LGHHCGKCKQYGHGFIECSNQQLIVQLQKYYKDQMPELERCTAKTCNYRNTHSIEAHFCLKCKGHHSLDTCDLYKQMPLCQNDEARKLMGTILGKIYVKLWIGMGQWAFYRRDAPGKLVESLSVQYDLVNSPEVTNFIDGYNNVGES